MWDEREIHFRKRPSKTYVSPRIADTIRIASKVFDSDGFVHEAILLDEVVLRKTPSGRQEVIAKFFEYDRELRVVTFQRWNTGAGRPFEKMYFSFTSSEIPLLLQFLQNAVSLHFPDGDKINVLDKDLSAIVTTKAAADTLLKGDLERIAQIAESEITERDVVALGYRRKQLARFERLLNDEAYFAAEAEGCGKEAVWQKFFETNPWVFGHGLSYVFMTSMDGRALEQTVRGFSVAGAGKRADALLKTRAEVSSLCLVEIKRHDTELLDDKPYRSRVFNASKELVGGVAQTQATVRAALDTIGQSWRPTDAEGQPTGEEIFGFEPRSYLVIGRLAEFRTENGINEDRFRSFETFRRNILHPEIITFDELLYRARFIVDQEAGDAPCHTI